MHLDTDTLQLWEDTGAHLGRTLTETKHGNPGESRRLPAGLIVRLIPASNLPDGSPIKWWAHPWPGNDWPAKTAQWAEGPGVGLGADDVRQIA